MFSNIMSDFTNSEHVLYSSVRVQQLMVPVVTDYKEIKHIDCYQLMKARVGAFTEIVLTAFSRQKRRKFNTDNQIAEDGGPLDDHISSYQSLGELIFRTKKLQFHFQMFAREKVQLYNQLIFHYMIRTHHVVHTAPIVRILGHLVLCVTAEQ